MSKTYHQELREKMNDYAHLVYKITKTFPKEELYGVTSQLRRSSLLVILNYIEGYARNRNKVHKNFLEISYGSLKESEYLLEFSRDEDLIDKKSDDFLNAISLADQIGAMLWSTKKSL